jgi:molecular chaperone HtpG
VGQGEGPSTSSPTSGKPSTRPARCGPAQERDHDDEQYKEFYKHVATTSPTPLAYTHNRVEGRSEYTQLLYIPAKAPFDLWDRDKRHGVKLYVKRVFIMDDAEQLMPLYLRFVRGVVDSADLPLNVSREILQESRDVKAIREGCTKRCWACSKDWPAENQRRQVRRLLEASSAQVLKEGMGEDFANQERLAKLLRFASTHDRRQACRWPTTWRA